MSTSTGESFGYIVSHESEDPCDGYMPGQTMKKELTPDNEESSEGVYRSNSPPPSSSPMPITPPEFMDIAASPSQHTTSHCALPGSPLHRIGSSKSSTAPYVGRQYSDLGHSAFSATLFTLLRAVQLDQRCVSVPTDSSVADLSSAGFSSDACLSSAPDSGAALSPCSLPANKTPGSSSQTVEPSATAYSRATTSVKQNTATSVLQDRLLNTSAFHPSTVDILKRTVPKKRRSSYHEPLSGKRPRRRSTRPFASLSGAFRLSYANKPGSLRRAESLRSDIVVSDDGQGNERPVRLYAAHPATSF